MNPALLVAILNFAVKFGLDAAILIGKALSRPDATIDEVIAALEVAKTKTAQDYLDEAKPVEPPGGWPPIV